MIHRLRGDRVETWALYPSFECRVIAFAQRGGVALDVPRAVADLRGRFHNAPLAAGYWLFTNPKQEIVGHVCGWLTLNMGRLAVFILQAEGTLSSEIRRGWAKDYILWLSEINHYRGKVPYIPAGPAVEDGELVTSRHPKAWQAYLGRLGFEVETRTIVKFRRKREEQEANDGIWRQRQLTVLH